MSDNHPSSPNSFEGDSFNGSEASSNTFEVSENEHSGNDLSPVVADNTIATENPSSAVEQRQQRREELLKRQQQARQSQAPPVDSTITNPVPIVEKPAIVEASIPTEVSPSIQKTEPNPNDSEPEPRPPMIAQALSFLNSPNVQTAPLSKKIAFLKKKGLTQAEIDMALEKVSLKGGHTELSPSNSTPIINNQATGLPPVPPRTYNQPSLAPQQISILVAPNPNAERIRNTIVALMITSGVTAGLLGLVKLAMLPIRNSFTQEQHLRYEQQSKSLQKFHDELVTYHQTLHSEEETSEGITVKSLEKSGHSLRQTLQKFETQLMVYQEINKSRERAMDEVKASFYDLTRSLGSTGYFSIYKLQAEHRSGLPAQIRSDIRSIKGLLLSRRTPFNHMYQQQQPVA
ncbi:hypothetical protein K7432_015033 [Basidiobolus ranarum]|uniref:Peroxisomal membrane protein PEX14 n=1 Tax=Basidiobolus ranarum TaxID=34480 RepID=A0ABR2WGN3_9FUNG